MSYIYHTFIYDPLYNIVVFLLGLSPLFDAGLVVIVFTIFVKLILFPLARKSVRTQILMRSAEKSVKEIKEKYKDKQEQALKIMQYYKEKGINPFSSILLLFVQLPILIALYKMFLDGLQTIDQTLLYSFVSAPEHVNTIFIGLIDVMSKSYIIAILAAISQFGYAYFAIPKASEKKQNESFQENMARNMNMQMKYVFPIVIFFISYYTGVALALYWTTSNIFMIGQEIFVRKQLAKKQEKKQV